MIPERSTSIQHSSSSTTLSLSLERCRRVVYCVFDRDKSIWFMLFNQSQICLAQHKSIPEILRLYYRHISRFCDGRDDGHHVCNDFIEPGYMMLNSQALLLNVSERQYLTFWIKTCCLNLAWSHFVNCFKSWFFDFS